MCIRFSISAVINLAKLVKMIKENSVLTVVSAMVDYKKNGYTLIVDTVWTNSGILAYRYIWNRQKLEIVADFEVIEEKTLKL